jgi:hypothetical protein
MSEQDYFSVVGCRHVYALTLIRGIRNNPRMTDECRLSHGLTDRESKIQHSLAAVVQPIDALRFAALVHKCDRRWSRRAERTQSSLLSTRNRFDTLSCPCYRRRRGGGVDRRSQKSAPVPAITIAAIEATTTTNDIFDLGFALLVELGLECVSETVVFSTWDDSGAVPRKRSIWRMSRSICGWKSRPDATKAALWSESSWMEGGKALGSGMSALLTKTGHTGIFNSKAFSISIRTGSVGWLMRTLSFPSRYQAGPMMARSKSVCCSASAIYVRKFTPSGMLSMSINTDCAPKWLARRSRILPVMASVSSRR